LAVGDVIEIENNTFALVQSIVSKNPQLNANFGTSIDQCPTNCSLYIGTPKDSIVEVESGSVDRWVNQNRLYGLLTGTVSNPVLNPGDTVRINNFDVTVTGFTIEEFATAIINANIPNVTATVSNGYLTISIANSDAALAYTQLLVLPGLGNAFNAIGLTPMAWTQTIQSPKPSPYTRFGSTVAISSDAMTLVVSSPLGTASSATTFDAASTLFDSRATEFFDNASESGVVYTYDYLPSVGGTILNPGKFVFGQQIYDDGLQSYDGFGSAISYVSGQLLIGSPYNKLGQNNGPYGRATSINNVKHSPSWAKLYQQQPIVDVKLINSVFAYNRITSEISQYLDYIDPIQGKILGAARQNIDYIAGIDPAAYNYGDVNNYGDAWADNHLGKVWWDTSVVRFIDYHQASTQYSSQRWGQLFKGSQVNVYQWIESDVPPAEYAGEGTPYNTTSYVIRSRINVAGLFTARYFFWVKGLTNVATNSMKTLSVQAVAQYIESPLSSGIPYVAFTAPNVVALYNVRPLLSAQDTVLHVEYDQKANDDNVHIEYDLIVNGNAESFLGAGLYRKLLDSFCGADTVGNTVPDRKLGTADLYGVDFRPRQSMFIDRFTALKNYITRANSLMALYPIAESRTLNLLKSAEAEPTFPSGAWDKRLETFAELTYQDLTKILPGYRYLIASDNLNQGLWTIYTVQQDKSFLLTRVQNYDTKQFWSYINWVRPGYNTSIKPVSEVANYSGLAELNVIDGSSAKVTKNSNGKYEIYQYINGVWNRVVLEDGTVAINADVWDYALGKFGFDSEVFDAQRYMQAPITETRQILKSINEEIFTGDILIHRNELLMLLFEYIMSEQLAPGWLFKTSLIDIDHKIRDLLPYPIYRRDNQSFVEDYLKEVKPYHVRIKQFNLRYTGFDLFDGTMTDFDVPAYYNNGIYVSPILDDRSAPLDENSSKKSTDSVWTQLPYNQWSNNYKLVLESIELLETGSGYTVPPQVEVIGDAEIPAQVTAIVNTGGIIVRLVIDYPGSGYLTTPTIVISGGNGTGGKAVAVLGNTLIRDIKTTIKYDRCAYTSRVVNWSANTDYTTGALIRFENKVYEASDSLNSGASFDPAQYTVIDQSTLEGIDRIIGLYDPTANEPGRALARIISGIDYPGVQVRGPDFSQNSGFDVGTYDINPFDNLEIGPEGLPTYDAGILDAIYESSFTDTYLGTRPTDINVAGGEFIDTYSSHAPEELVPGSIFDTLDMKVYTRPGSDWSGIGYGFDIKSTNSVYNNGAVIDFGNQIIDISTIRVINANSGRALTPADYTVNWAEHTVTITSGATNGDIIDVQIYGIGGGNQLFKKSYLGGEIGNSLVVPVAYSEVANIDLFVNGERVHAYTYTDVDHSTLISFDTTYTNTDLVVVVVLGAGGKDISYPVTEYFELPQATPGSTFTLTNVPQGLDVFNVIVERGGQRLRPPESIEYYGNASDVEYALPTKGKIYQALIADNSVRVFVDGVLQSLIIDYTVSSGTSDRYITFNSAPGANSHIVIVVTTSADYTIINNQLTLRVGGIIGDSIAVTTWADGQEQDILTQVFLGPTVVGTVAQETYDETPYDPDVRLDSNNGTPGTFDYAAGTIILENDLETGRALVDSARLWVTKNGHRLLPGSDYTVNGTRITIGGGTLGQADVIAITHFTQTVVPDSITFRLFQDMRGSQLLYRMTGNNTTRLVRNFDPSDDVIYLEDVSHLSIPDLTLGSFGTVTIDKERITYRHLDAETNTISGIRRGVLGTSIDEHYAGALVTDIGFGEALPHYYQPRIQSQKFATDGYVYQFTCDELTLSTTDPSVLNNQVRVRVGGADIDRSTYTVSNSGTIVVELAEIPRPGVTVEAYIVQATVMYGPGLSEASNGIPLQYQETLAGQFIQGAV
jgi:hypothetical protein